MEPIPTSARSDFMLTEIWKVEHIFRDIGRAYTFSLVKASRLPLLVKSSGDSVGFFASEFPITPETQSTYDRLKPRLLSMQPEPQGTPLSLNECGCIETVAHHIRRNALLESSPERRKDLFHTAYVLYRSFLFVCAYPPLTAIVKDIPSMEKRLVMITPIPKLDTVHPELRRRVAHCFAGMALCALMGYQNPVLCYGLASAAVGWEPVRPLELINLVRVNLLLVGKYKLGLANLGNTKGFEFVTDSMDTLDTLMGMDGSSLVRLPNVYGMMNQQLVLPAVLKFGTAVMLDREREIIGEKEWVESLKFATSVNQRIEDRASGRIPTPTKLTHVKVVDGKFAERLCGGCGVWQGDTERKLERCSGCKLVYYCSRECQKRDWKAHKATCK